MSIVMENILIVQYNCSINRIQYNCLLNRTGAMCLVMTHVKANVVWPQNSNLGDF